jgi:hypothetical protein
MLYSTVEVFRDILLRSVTNAGELSIAPLRGAISHSTRKPKSTLLILATTQEK